MKTCTYYSSKTIKEEHLLPKQDKKEINCYQVGIKVAPSLLKQELVMMTFLLSPLLQVAFQILGQIVALSGICSAEQGDPGRLSLLAFLEQSAVNMESCTFRGFFKCFKSFVFVYVKHNNDHAETMTALVDTRLKVRLT